MPDTDLDWDRSMRGSLMSRRHSMRFLSKCRVGCSCSTQGDILERMCRSECLPKVGSGVTVNRSWWDTLCIMLSLHMWGIKWGIWHKWSQGRTCMILRGSLGGRLCRSNNIALSFILGKMCRLRHLCRLSRGWNIGCIGCWCSCTGWLGKWCRWGNCLIDVE